MPSQNPWLEFAQKARPWDVVRGAVKYVKTDRVVVEIRPGVDGVIALADLSTSLINRPEEVVWPGDHLEAVILRINPGAHRLQLSIRHHLERLSLINQVLGQMKEQEPSPSLPQLDLIDDLPEIPPILELHRAHPRRRGRPRGPQSPCPVARSRRLPGDGLLERRGSS